MKKKEFKNTDELLEYAKQAIGHPFKEYDINHRLKANNGKGNIGNVIEEGFFGYKINNKQEADFPELGVELKVTPYKKIYNGVQISAKERLVLTMINYMEDYNVSFKKSHCYEKIDKILMMFYEHKKDKYSYDFMISKVFLYQFDDLPEIDKKIIIDDYEYIMNKIKKGEAHLISEGDTSYLGACTKGETKEKSIISQPFSDVPAQARAFTLKSSYMTQLLRSDFFNNNAISSNNLIENPNVLTSKSLTEVILDYFDKYKDKTLDDIDKLANVKVNRSNKSYLKSYTSIMLDKQNVDVEQLDEFKKANIKIKTIRITKNGNVKESMSFPAFKAKELVNEKWEDSTLRNQFLSEKYLFCIFDEIDDNSKDYKFRKAIIWNMPESILEKEVKSVWKDTQKKLNGKLELKIQESDTYGVIVKNNFTTSSDKKVIHVRPHTSKRYYRLKNNMIIGKEEDKGCGDLLPDGRIITKQCFFLNKAFINDIIIKD